MDALTMTGFLLMGLTSSLHCAGMCGPIVWVMPFQHLPAAQRGIGIGLYHAGRIAAYSMLAALAFSLRHAFQPQWQQTVALVSGALLLVAGLASFFRLEKFRLLRPLSGLVLKALSRVAGRTSPGWLGATGFLNGLLPCGMVYIALAAAMKMPDLPHAMLAIVFFGAGTVPMLIAVTLLRRRIRFSTTRWAHGLMLIFGMLLMLRGANLGIPYLSPQRAEAPPGSYCSRAEMLPPAGGSA